MREETVKELVRGWYLNKAKNETDEFYKLLCLWICFNAWLSHIVEENSDARMIQSLIDNPSFDLSRAYRSMAQTTTGKQALIDFSSMSPIADSREMRPEIVIRDAQDRESIIRGIYRVRCNLFHGGKNYNEIRDKKLVKCANRVLDKWMSELIGLWRGVGNA